MSETMVVFHTRILSDIDISYPFSLDQEYSETIRLWRSPLNELEKMEHGYNFDNNQKRAITISYHKHSSAPVKGRLIAFHVEKVVTFHWESGSGVIYYIPGIDFTPELLRYWFLHNTMMYYLILERCYLFLHAGAVRVGKKSILFAAQSYGGKSTMTDYFIRQGHAMISDDNMPVDRVNGMYRAIPSYPYHRPHRGVEDLGFFVSNVPSGPAPLDALYRLKRSEADSAIIITELKGVEKFKALYHSNEVNFSFYKALDMQYLSDMAKVIPVYEITVPWDMERLHEVYGVIVEYSASL